MNITGQGSPPPHDELFVQRPLKYKLVGSAQIKPADGKRRYITEQELTNQEVRIMKRILAIILAVALVAAVFWTVNPVTPAYAEEYRSGFLLTPDQYDSTGIYTDTGFTLKTEKNYTLEQIKEMLRLTGDISLKITQGKDGAFLIVPERELNANSLYTFVLSTPEKIRYPGPSRHAAASQSWEPFRQTSPVTFR